MKHERDRRWAVSKDDGLGPFDIEERAGRVATPLDRGTRHRSMDEQERLIDQSVREIEKAIEGLESKGVVFEDYDFPDFKTVNHVCVLGAEKAAWFKDPEGNYLCLHEDLA